MKIKVIKGIDAVAGKVLASVLPGGKKEPLSGVESCLFIRPGGIGDAVLLLPALRALKAAYPGCAIDVLAEERNAAAFEFSSCVRTVQRYDSASGVAGSIKGNYGVVVDTEQWHRLSAVVGRFVRARRRIGFATNERKRLFTDPVPYDLEQYEAFSFFRLLEPLGIEAPLEVPLPFVELPPEAVEAADRLLAPVWGRPFAVIFPGASNPQKQWGADNFRKVASHLALRGLPVVIVGGEDIGDVAAWIARQSGGVDLSGRTSLAETAAVLGKGRVLVTGDSGLLHIAAGLGVPTVSLFGPSDPRKWAPRGDQHRFLAPALPCAPCSRWGAIPSCPEGGGCLAEIAVADVVAGVEKVLSGERKAC